MVALLKVVLGEDDLKKAHRSEKFDKMEDDAKALADTAAGHKTAIEDSRAPGPGVYSQVAQARHQQTKRRQTVPCRRVTPAKSLWQKRQPNPQHFSPELHEARRVHPLKFACRRRECQVARPRSQRLVSA